MTVYTAGRVRPETGEPEKGPGSETQSDPAEGFSLHLWDAVGSPSAALQAFCPDKSER